MKSFLAEIYNLVGFVHGSAELGWYQPSPHCPQSKHDWKKVVLKIVTPLRSTWKNV